MIVVLVVVLVVDGLDSMVDRSGITGASVDGIRFSF